MPVKPAFVVFVAVLPALAAGAAEVGCPGPLPEAAAVTLAGLDDTGDLQLADGRRLRLIGLAARQDEAETERLSAGIAPWRGRSFALVLLSGPDRWGRLPARLLSADGPPGSAPVDLAVALLHAGAAQRLPEPAYPACDALLRRAAVAPGPATAQARAGAVSVVDGHDVAALRAQAGRIVALQGRIASVGERSQRTYLNLSRRRGEAASIVMTRTLWREMQDKGWTAATLPGKRVLARGVLSGQDGLLLEIGAASALDMVD